ncbi:hypothetical protein [Streptomyces virginiae]|uniref:hypothetical protein n=1 Tax=Streptomyces virginiae TaxID=1961 RepID=UPI0032443B29
MGGRRCLRPPAVLPHPFQDVLLYDDNDNRPAHRILFAYASLLNLKDPTAAAPWFTALVYLNPPDNLGARFLAPDGPKNVYLSRPPARGPVKQ